MNKATNEYFQALERLIKNIPNIVEKNSKINKDTVALEAGRKRGSIKRSRHPELTKAIEEASNSINNPKREIDLKLKKIKEEKDYFETEYKNSLARELMMIERISELEKELIKIKSIITSESISFKL
jgi:CRISPR/Cas system-associated protein Cas5 (RAMP superfamily)